MQKLVFLTGAGVSAESGLNTFRDSGGLWENYAIEDVAHIDAWHKNPLLVLDFYNFRRAEAAQAQPNVAHQIIADLEKYFQVGIVTQNVDNLHERAGSSHVVHLHGSLFEAKSSQSDSHVVPILGQIQMGDLAADGSQLRPNIVWFGEAVPMMETAISMVETADILVVVGTSLQVYPAAGLVNYTQPNVPMYLIDPKTVSVSGFKKFTHIAETATEGMQRLRDMLLA